VLHVIDGDTLALHGIGNARLIGIDTPELGRDGGPDAPFAVQAGEALRQLVATSGQRIRLVAGMEKRDRHGRRLAHVYDGAGRNLNEILLRRGLAYLSIFPPNLRFLDCYAEAEAEARRASRGLWSAPALQAADLGENDQGFRRVAGKVQSVGRKRNTAWIALDGGLEAHIREQDLAHFNAAMLDSLTGRRVELRGWLYRYRGKPRMRIRHPSAFIIPSLPDRRPQARAPLDPQRLRAILAAAE
jgi:endonuclease YncB( thermonuclease family)